MLNEYDCVVVPGFGGFVTHFESASIVSDKNLILPPYKRLSFNVNLNKNDGLLAHETVLKCGISYEEALLSIQNLAKQWAEKLEVNKFLEVETLGSFRKTKEGNILYEQAAEENYLLDSYGLTAVHVQVLEKDGISGKIKKELVQRKSSPNFNKKLRKYVVASSASLVLAALVIWSSVNFGTIQQKASELNLTFWKTNSEKVIVENKKSVAEVSESVVVEQEQNIDLSTDTVPFYIENEIATFDEIPEKQTFQGTETVSSTAINNSNKYIIVAGCFQSQENANNFVEALKKLGYNAHLAGNSAGGLYRVAYDSFPDLFTANDSLSGIRLQHNANAWITEIQ